MEKLHLIDERTTSFLYQSAFELIESIGLQDRLAHVVTSVCLLIAAFLLLALVDFLLEKLFDSVVTPLIRKTKTHWDDYLLDNRAQVYLAHLIMVVISQQLLPSVFVGFPSFTSVLGKFLSIVLIFEAYRLANSLLKTGRDILRTSKVFTDKPLDSYLQVLQIFLLFVGFILTVSILTGNSPWSFLVSLGAASAILMLVFKDTILGFVASIQVSANDSVRVGDWIEMPKYGVDGDVLQINLNNVRVQNWDKTIVTIPTHTLLSDSFKNYRGMKDSGGRRIKRPIHIKISSIRYLSGEEIENLKKIALLAPYIAQREEEIRQYNRTHNVDQTMPVNGRRMTNVGLFRAYVKAYARHSPNIHQGMTLLVRQLNPTEKGLPLELYMFTKGTEWAFFEDVMSDVFDHLFAAIKYFDLEVFELPASDDVRRAVRQAT